ncbi:hypothetical protein [Krasilnikoviella flava]|uniref:Uncharacterized protein n=1 Tax=Krasilnikoviella flava TaxID=526729 RepID=A0A1T5ILZ8_9MICO|nr:hypothetical protein [Krasilnikoviella flava]SKC40196.1 hypothetical protein SAMN04324258_0682 [Krasilnikoviella flava]
MNDDERAGDGAAPDDEPLARLRAADPAAGVGSSPGVLRAKVDARLAEDGDPLVAQVETAPDGDELAARRRRRTPWLAVAGVAALAVVGGGGYLLGGASAQGAGSADAAGGAAAPIVLNGGPQGDRAAAGAEGSAAAGAAEDRAAGGDDAAASTAAGDATLPSWYSSGRALFHADGLSTEGGTAAAYAFDATDAATREGAARVAKALDVDGEPRWDYGWSVGPRDGDGPTLWLSADGSATFGYSDPGADPWRCEGAVARDAEEGAEPDCEQPATSTVGDREARDALADAMRSLGVDPDGFEIEVGEKAEGEPGRWVTAYQVVDGTRTGAQWSATVGEKGVAWLDGFLAATVDLGEYPVISPAEAVERLGDPRFSGSAWPVAYADEEGMWAEAETEGGLDEPSPAPAPPAAGDPVDWPVSDVEITDARLGLAQQTQDDGSVVLVPAYELSDADGNAWSVVAVADDGMDFSAPR